MAASASDIDLGAPRGVRDVIATATRVWRSRPSVFLLIAVLVVVPIEFVLYGVVEGGFRDPYGRVSEGAAAFDGLVTALIYGALISATHARAVVLLADGRATTGQVLRSGFATLGPVLVVVMIYTVAVMFGTVLLILPGIFAATVGAFAPQVKALTSTGATSSFGSSNDLVAKVGFGPTFALVVLAAVANPVALAVLDLGLVPVADAIDDAAISGPLAVGVRALVTAVAFSWAALVTTIQYFAWRARAGDPWGAPAGGDPELARGDDWSRASH